ncbi:MAG: bifunctional 4-hydroxy-3-methylbut-2-enyl diphosphate reductase/30S ribosomal protein S1 [Eubacteriales bacterium]|nr:bifunctional 4-hydroxy-3-methylbut-2-enyl diphosphate reductase/30S ribosomal protein S1 [Eubacteriales bacterium]
MNKYNYQIYLAKSAGFCPGVKRAVDRAYALASQHRGPGALLMYGDLVHNDQVIEDLQSQGFALLRDLDQVLDRQVDTVLIRAHGISESEEQILRSQARQLEDCTCVWVKRVQDLARRAQQEGKGFILCGDPDHPEVRGIRSRAGNPNLVLRGPEDLEALDFAAWPGLSWILAAQTTFALDKFATISKILKNKLLNLEIFDTICRTTAQRQKEAAELARSSDIVLVLGSERSSNTNKLFQICRTHCSRTYLIQRPDQVAALLRAEDLRQMRIGITAGASTPERMIREVIHVMTEQNNFSQENEMLNPVAENPGAEEVKEQDPQAQVQESGIDTDQEASSAFEAYASEADETAEEEDDSEDFSFSDYIEGIPQLKRGVIVTGPIVRYDDEYVYVDVKDKSEGKVPRHEFVDDPEFDLDQAVANHDEVEVYVRSIKNTDMGKEIMLSKAKVDFEKHKDVIRQAYEDQTPITVKVTNVVKDGVIASYGGVDLYIHRTQLELRRVDDLEPYRGKTMEVLITQFDPNRRRLRVSGSRRSLVQRERSEKSQAVWDTIEVGKEYEGVVRNITNFGAFVDLGGVDGLVHVSELSWRRIKHPSEVVSVGDHLKVFVLDFDKEKDRISLGYRREENDPYYNIEERFPLGSIVRGIVVRMFPFGAFIEVAPGVDALCHISQISNYHLKHPEDVLQVGMEVDARVLAVSNQERKISISIKEVEAIDPANPEEYTQHEPRQDRGNRDEDGQARKPRRSGRRSRQDQEGSSEPTTYVDSSAGSSFASLANVTVASEAGAEFMEKVQKEEEAARAAAEAKAQEKARAEAEARAKAKAEAEAAAAAEEAQAPEPADNLEDSLSQTEEAVNAAEEESTYETHAETAEPLA